MTAPEKLPGEVWRGLPNGLGSMLTVCIHDGVPLVWRTIEGGKEYVGSGHAARADALSAWGLAMMAERDAAIAAVARPVNLDEAAEHAVALIGSRPPGDGVWLVARALLGMLAEREGAMPSLPGYGHDEEPVVDEAARLLRWYERTGKTIITKPREP